MPTWYFPCHCFGEETSWDSLKPDSSCLSLARSQPTTNGLIRALPQKACLPGGIAVQSSGGEGCSGSLASARGREPFLETLSQPCPDACAKGPGREDSAKGEGNENKGIPRTIQSAV